MGFPVSLSPPTRPTPPLKINSWYFLSNSPHPPSLTHTHTGKINSWDFQYYNTLLKERKYTIDEDKVKQVRS